MLGTTNRSHYYVFIGETRKKFKSEKEKRIRRKKQERER